MSATRRQQSSLITDNEANPMSATPTGAVDAVTASPAIAVTPKTGRKDPPPEKPSDVRRRSWVILSFWLIVIFLGLPIWWYTTSIYRANLPVEQMLNWADGKVNNILQNVEGCASLLLLTGVCCIGLPSRLSIAHLDTSRFSSRTRSTKSRPNRTTRPR